ncbi:hypothetical protein POM88_051364 [Heracleum sosnowskyi]|uniref:Uncharacterized protein n=1 Tax=Heracleum sosnowskyi TaxID=360622 RepID=A0AAD8H1R6_9APIA|nr:hypothetical protein POM88_051364 [Heracleum sosnowskyi]
MNHNPGGLGALKPGWNKSSGCDDGGPRLKLLSQLLRLRSTCMRIRSTENGIKFCNEDGDLLIHTDGTGFISEDLARKCPSALLSARYLKNNSLKSWECNFSLGPGDAGSVAASKPLPPSSQPLDLFHPGLSAPSPQGCGSFRLAKGPLWLRSIHRVMIFQLSI